LLSLASTNFVEATLSMGYALDLALDVASFGFKANELLGLFGGNVLQSLFCTLRRQ